MEFFKNAYTAISMLFFSGFSILDYEPKTELFAKWENISYTENQMDLKLLNGEELTGHLYTPRYFDEDEDKTYKTVVILSESDDFSENYAEQYTKRGYVVFTLTRKHEFPEGEYTLNEFDMRNVISHLRALKHTDRENLFAISFKDDANLLNYSALGDSRIKKIANIAPELELEKFRPLRAKEITLKLLRDNEKRLQDAFEEYGAKGSIDGTYSSIMDPMYYAEKLQTPYIGISPAFADGETRKDTTEFYRRLPAREGLFEVDNTDTRDFETDPKVVDIITTYTTRFFEGESK